MAEELVLPAKVTDGFSKPLKDLVDKLRNLRPSPALQATQRHFVDLRKQVEAVGNAMKGMGSGLAGGLGLPGLSLGALSAAGAMAALGASVRSFATTTVDLKNFQAATGIAVTKLKELKAVAAGLGVSEDAIQSALSFSAQNADALRRGYGNINELRALGPGGRSIAADLANTKSNDEVLEKELRYMNAQKSAEQRKTLAGLFFGDESMAAFGVDGIAALNKRRAAARSSIGGQSKQDEKNAQTFLDATSKISLSLDKLKNAVGGALAPDMAALAEAVNGFTTAHSKEVSDFFKGIGEALGAHNWKEDADAIGLVFGKTKEFVEYLAKLSPDFDAKFNKDRGATEDGGNYSVWGNILGARKGSMFDWLLQHKMDFSATNGGTFLPGAPGQPSHPHTTTPTPGTDPNANRGMRDTFMGADPIAYRPGARLGALGIASASQSLAVATIAAGVLKGMQDFASSLQGGGVDGAGAGAAGGAGFQNASLNLPAGGARFGGGGRGGSTSANGYIAPLSGTQLKGTSSEMVSYIRQAAIARGIDPDVALRVARGEGGLVNPYRHGEGPAPRGQDPRYGPKENSFGPFQLWISGRGKGLGDRAVAAGVDPRTNWKGGIDFALDEVRRKGWGQWYGARAAGITGMRGVGPLPPRKSAYDAASKKSAADAAAAGKDGAHGKVSVEIISPDARVKTKGEGPALQDLTVKRGKAAGLMEI